MGLYGWLFGGDGGAPDEGEAHRKRGAAHLARGEYAEAVAAFRAALESRPDDSDLRRALAACHRALGDEVGAAGEADAARALAERAAERWAGARGRPVAVFWDGEVVGHFVAGAADDYPRVKGGWTSAGSRPARRFEGIVVRPDYASRAEPLHVRLGSVAGDLCRVDGVSVVTDSAGREATYLLNLTVLSADGGVG